MMKRDDAALDWALRTGLSVGDMELVTTDVGLIERLTKRAQDREALILFGRLWHVMDIETAQHDGRAAAQIGLRMVVTVSHG